MPSSVQRSIKISGQSVMVAIRATTGRFSLRTTARAVIDLNVRGASCIGTSLDLDGHCHAGFGDGHIGSGSADLSALQVIFPFESGSDLLDHFATIGIV